MVHHDPNEELTELKHDAVPGYRPVFLVVIAVAAAYLAYIFINS